MQCKDDHSFHQDLADDIDLNESRYEIARRIG